MTPPPNGLGRIDSKLREWLLALARRAIEEYLGRGVEATAPRTEPTHEEIEGLFVTLKHRGDLRGCIGVLQATVPIAEVVQQCAVSAARDPRFSPLTLEELPRTRIEISILGPPRRILGPRDFRVGEEGLVVTLENWKGLLLPQVASERGWDARRFLQETCLKAGLHSDAWRTGATVEAFAAETFTDGESGRQGSDPT